MTAVAQTPRRRETVRAGSASTLGWAMDLHDLMLILYIAPVIAPLFFPSESETLALAGVYASFAVSLVMRPVGSAVFGAYADRNGRKKAAYVTIGGVGIITALMGLVPTYYAIGVAAPIIFLLLRLTQGIFVGGIVASTHTLGTETVSPNRRGLMSGIIGGAGAGIAAILVSVNYMVFSSVFTGDAFSEVGWRLMFATGILTSIVSIWLYVRAAESPLWKETQAAKAGAEKAPSPVRELFVRYRRTLLANVLLVTGGASLYYLTAGFFPNYFESNVGMTPMAASTALIVVNVCVCFGGILGGYLSDLFGRRTVFLVTGGSMVLLGPAIYHLLVASEADQWLLITALGSVAAFLGMAAGGPILIFLNERFPTHLRATGTALSWNVGFALAGMSPTFVTALSPEMADVTSRGAVFIGAGALLFVVLALILREEKKMADPVPTTQ